METRSDTLARLVFGNLRPSLSFRPEDFRRGLTERESRPGEPDRKSPEDMNKAAEFRSFVTGRLNAASRDILAAFDRLMEEWEPEAASRRQSGVEGSRCCSEEEQKEDLHPSGDVTSPMLVCSSRTQNSKKGIQLRIRFLEDPQTDVLSRNMLQRGPVLLLRCPAGLTEQRFCELLRGSSPQPMAADAPLDLLTWSRGRTLQPLEVCRRTPELIQASLKKSILYVRTRAAEEPKGCTTNISTICGPSSSLKEETEHHTSSKHTREEEEPQRSEARSHDGQSGSAGGPSPQQSIHIRQQMEEEEVSEADQQEAYQGAACQEAFGEKEDHQKVQGTGEHHRCYICHQQFTLKEQLKAHRKTHSQQKTQQCGVCGKTLVDYRSLSRHMMVHSGERPHRCRQCGKNFKLLGALRQHQKIHTERQRSFLCHVCCKMFLTSQELNNHMSTHSEERPHLCAHCGRGFSKKTALTLHQRTHSGDTPHRCSHCGRGFKRRSNLQQHLSVHTGEKPYVCITCGKACARKVYLSVHVRTHSGERPYTCSVCHRGFSQSHSLKTHMRSHQGAPSAPQQHKE